MSTNPPLPRLEKLRGISKLMESKRLEFNKFGVFDTRVSKAGQGVSILCKEMDAKCIVYFPVKKQQMHLEEQQQIAKDAGAILCPLAAKRTAILYAKAKKDAQSKGAYMLPLGLVCEETVEEVRKISETITGFGSIIVSVGTGMITAGILSGNDTKVYGISCGMKNKKQLKRIKEKLIYPEKIKNLTLIPPESDYYQPYFIRTPVPMHPYYDAKAWKWLIENYESIEKPVLFWLIGS